MAWRSPCRPDPSAGLSIICKKAAADISQAAEGCVAKAAEAAFAGFDPTIQAALIAIFFSLFWACSVFGSVTVSTPFLKFASILSASTPSGTPNERWNEP
jgi:hypothetical protein